MNSIDVESFLNFRIKPDGEGSAPILVTHNDGLISMAFDWVSKQLYYIDNIRNSLEVVKVSEQVCAKTQFITRITGLKYLCFYMQGLVHPDQLVRRQLLVKLRDPISLVVHPWRGLLFFAEAERPARIWRCFIDATNCQVIR